MHVSYRWPFIFLSLEQHITQPDLATYPNAGSMYVTNSIIILRECFLKKNLKKKIPVGSKIARNAVTCNVTRVFFVDHREQHLLAKWLSS